MKFRDTSNLVCGNIKGKNWMRLKTNVANDIQIRF